MGQSPYVWWCGAPLVATLQWRLTRCCSRASDVAWVWNHSCWAHWVWVVVMDWLAGVLIVGFPLPEKLDRPTKSIRRLNPFFRRLNPFFRRLKVLPTNISSAQFRRLTFVDLGSYRRNFCFRRPALNQADDLSFRGHNLADELLNFRRH